MQPNFSKNKDGLIPAIVQDAETDKVLMLAYMNQQAYIQTVETKVVTFYSRSKGRLWVKGETSGNHLDLVSVTPDCDNDALLVKVHPRGPACHTGADTCFGETNDKDFLLFLEDLIAERQQSGSKNSYTASLFEKGINKIAQKVGEEAVELVIESKDDNRELFLNEAADLLFHYLILLTAKGLGLSHVLDVLRQRHKA